MQTCTYAASRSSFHAACLRRVGEVAVFGARGDIDAAITLGFLDRFLRPFAGVHVVGALLAAQQVHRHGRELQRRPALQEQHFVVGGNREQLAQVGFGLRGNADRTPCRGGSSPSPTCRCRASRASRALACSSTGSGNTAGPAAKLKIRDIAVKPSMDWKSADVLTSIRLRLRVRPELLRAFRRSPFSSSSPLDDFLQAGELLAVAEIDQRARLAWRGPSRGFRKCACGSARRRW